MTDQASLTLFLCGPSKCEHDFSSWEDMIEDSLIVGGTAICSKCGASAYDEAVWL